MWKKILGILLTVAILFTQQTIQVSAIEVEAPSAILLEASTGKVIFEQNATERRSPASITKIMTLLLTFEALEKGKISLEDQVITSEHAKSMGGSQVYLEEGEAQSLETMIKCIVVASGNDASVAVAEHIAGSEEAFLELMNAKAAELGMIDTNFEDCCGLTDSDNHYTSAKDVAIMSRELITKYPEIFNYTQIWMEDITHETARGSSSFTLSSTNKLLKQYQWTTGLKTGSTSKAKYCISATANKDGMELISVIMGAEDPKTRFREAAELLNYGYSICSLYVDSHEDPLPMGTVKGGVEDQIHLEYEGEFRYVDTEGNNIGEIQKEVQLPESFDAPIKKGEEAGKIIYSLHSKTIGQTSILFATDIEKAGFLDYLKKASGFFLL